MSNAIVETLMGSPLVAQWTDGTKNPTISNLSLLVAELIPIVEGMISGRGRGSYKKEILMGVVRAILRQTKAPKETCDLAEELVPKMVDTMVTLTNATNTKCCVIV